MTPQATPAVRSILAVLLITGFHLASAQQATAKPKKPLVNGCTEEQLQSQRASACIDQMEEDIKNGVRYVHFVMCGDWSACGSDMCCCQGDDTRTFGCKGLMTVKLPGVGAPEPAGVRGDPGTPPVETTPTIKPIGPTLR